MYDVAIRILKEVLNNKKDELSNHVFYYERIKNIKTCKPEMDEKIIQSLKYEIEEIGKSISHLEKAEETKGFKIVCNSCNKLINIKKQDNNQWDINNKESVSIYIFDGYMEIQCSCGNKIEITNIL